jgi:alkylhydroperoxidase/carboxymuconolactone decarboxylase family protein YurZ
MVEIARLHRGLVARALEGDGAAAPELRRAAFDNDGLSEPIRTLIGKVVEHAYQVTDEDVVAVRAAGLSEDQIFEIVICAAIGQASRQYATALAALASAVEEERAP